MVIVQRAAGTGYWNATVATQAITAPACNVNDILIAVVINKALANVISPPDATWTEIYQGPGDCTTAADDHRAAVYWKRATASGGNYTFTKATDDNVLFGGAIVAYGGCKFRGDPTILTANASDVPIVASYTVLTGANMYYYEDLTSVTDYVIATDDVLNYDIYWTSSTDFIAFDFTCSDTSTLRDTAGEVDQNSLGAHPSTDLSAYAANAWYSRSIPILAKLTGKTIANYDIACEYDTASTKTAYLRNIKIMNGVTLKKTIYNGTGLLTHALHMSTGTTLRYLDRQNSAYKINAAAADNVTYGIYRPYSEGASFGSPMSEIVYVAVYGNDLTTFATDMVANTNPKCVNFLDVETSTGTDVTIAITSGPTTDGTEIAARTWASASTTDAGSSAIIFELIPEGRNFITHQ